MSYALETSKRKFHRLLDSISNTPSASTATAHARNAPNSAVQPPTKRFRPNDASKDSISNQSKGDTDFSTSSLRSIRAVSHNLRTQTKRSPYKTLSGDEVQPYAPSSRTDFLLRLKTFSFHGIVNWHLKPERINEVQWAKHGWVLQGRETVRCTNCHRQLVVEYSEEKTEDDDEDDAIDETQDEQQGRSDLLAEKYVELLRAGHDERCLWRERSCDDTIYRLPVNTPSVALPALRERYESVLKMHDKLPRTQPPQDVDIAEIFEKFVGRAYSEERVSPTIPSSAQLPETDAKHTAFTFALLGWYAADSDQLKDGMVSCGSCFRRLGFWMWPQNQQSGGDDGAEPLACDIVQEHRPYCPWQNGELQNAGAAQFNYVAENLSGWECLVRLLTTHKKLLREDDASQESPPDPSSSPQRPATAGTDDTNGDSMSIAESGKERDLEHKERIGRWQRLKKSLTLHKNKKV